MSGAIATYQKAIELRPKDADARFNLGNAYFASRNFSAAADSYRVAIQDRPDYARAHYNLGMALVRQKNRKAAQAEFAQAHRLDPNMPESPELNAQ
jgi:tetratricopeptide (TPR) repeat protein